MTNDRVAVATVITRLYRLLDEQRFDELGSVYADDAVLEFPRGEMRGLAAITAKARERAQQYPRMQHLNTDVEIELDGDAARVRSNHLAFHVEESGARFDAGLVHHFEAARTPNGWRLTRGTGNLIWSS
ncbi:nuclear transport factor 2 family protein [Solirubrobacter phytolaccae]|uniref:Nuclear transport factor 2 family protein n=1 Tax=Solirubrobacter phytolaccae TaxID=1404360 RepID=A0A9X3NCE3_9ACTN|nr:nuclear transport factor 2 family protein [Solirubrobacter phytolaccae]MDA0183878.1 nuclear transport factor 2 family protein [Solirubrobacter phytolaccae]